MVILDDGGGEDEAEEAGKEDDMAQDLVIEVGKLVYIPGFCAFFLLELVMEFPAKWMPIPTK